MKRTIIAIALLTALFLPAVVTAQVDYSTLTAEQRIVLIQELEAKLKELISILMVMLQEQVSVGSATQQQIDVQNPVDTTSQTNQQTTQNMPEEKPLTLSIHSSYSETGLGRDYHVSPIYPEIKDASNYIQIFLAIKDSNGKYLSDKNVSIVATDISQNKTINGTGNLSRIYVNGNKQSVPSYGYLYKFNKIGKHIITFTADGQSASVEVDVK